ncbi:MAG: DUF1002 domain-containing protein [Lachnospiraceae bacterium]|nr:DUF1002 domain-containing protein [Lachnospiraceae bacterium]
MNRIKKSLLLFLLVFLFGGIQVNAAQDETAADTGISTMNEGETFIAFGADLTEEQKAEVVRIFGLSDEELSKAVVVTVTNEEEHQYLGDYLESSVIGTKSLSSVLVRKAEAGHGVVVTTKNITYCTTGMYRNALLTAGVEDADIIVAAPTPISGTAGLIGAIRAYEKMSGETVSEESLDTALNELVATGEIATVAKSADDAKVEELIAYIKAKLAAGELETEEDIRNAVIEGEEKFGVDLSDEDVDKIVSLMKKIETLGIDPELLLSQAKDLYDKFGDGLLEDPESAIKDAAGNMVKSAFTEMVENIKTSITDFFKNLFR